MKKLVRGIIDFKEKKQGDYCKKFSHLSETHAPDALLIACCDSRVVPNIFASSDPGDLFVLRNMGNIVPPSLCCDGDGIVQSGDMSVAAAIEYSLRKLDVFDIIVCGHSECGAMQAVIDNALDGEYMFCGKWFEHIMPSYERFLTTKRWSDMSPCNILSRINVLQQLDNIKTHPAVIQRLQEGRLKLHGWWFDLATADVLYYDERCDDFVAIDEIHQERIFERGYGR